ncbi:MAG: sulfatase [Gemmatimonadota bacterium]|nr:sulfatase [Gemmatimonadota bacterium]
MLPPAITERARRSGVLATLAILLGAVAGLADGLLAAGGALPFARLPAAASLGAVLALAGLLPALPLLVAPAWRASRALAGGVVWLACLPGVLAVGKLLYKRLPWDAADAAVALGLVAALAAGGALGAVAIGVPLRGRGGRANRALLRVAPLAALLLLPMALRLAPGSAPKGSGSGPNLLVLTIDTIRTDSFGMCGNPSARTPHTDRIARRATLYPVCVAPSPWTLPSLASLLTGSHPGEHRMLEELSGLSADVPTLAEACRDAGMRTGAIVSNPWLATGNLSRGFDTFDVAERVEPVADLSGMRICRALTKVLLRFFALDCAETLSASGMRWVHSGEGRWFLWLHYFDPHLPNWPGFPWDRLFGPPPVHVGASLTVEEIRAGSFPGGDGGRAEIARLYEGEVARTDAGIGRVWRFLEGRGELATTAIVLSGDHGEELWDHAGYGHGHAMFDEVVRVPLIIRPAKGGAPTVARGLGRIVDLAPTAAGVAEVPLPTHPAFRGNDLTSMPPATAAFGEAVLYGEEQKFLRTARWKAVLPAGATTIRLFDLHADPAEAVDLAAREAALAESLRVELLEWVARVGSAGAMAARDASDHLDPALVEQLKALGYIR